MNKRLMNIWGWYSSLEHSHTHTHTKFLLNLKSQHNNPQLLTNILEQCIWIKQRYPSVQRILWIYFYMNIFLLLSIIVMILPAVLYFVYELKMMFYIQQGYQEIGAGLFKLIRQKTSSCLKLISTKVPSLITEQSKSWLSECGLSGLQIFQLLCFSFCLSCSLVCAFLLLLMLLTL